MQTTSVPLTTDSPLAATAPERFSAAGVLGHGAQVALANFAIAGLIATINGGRFGHILLYAQCIGLSIWLLVEFGRPLAAGSASRWPAGWRGRRWSPSLARWATRRASPWPMRSSATPAGATTCATRCS